MFFASFSSAVFTILDYQTFEYVGEDNPRSIGFLNCTNPVTGDPPRYVKFDTGGCDSGGYIYAILEENFSVMDMKVGCHLMAATVANWTHSRNVSSADVDNWLVNGFWMSWFLPLTCMDQCGKDSECSMNQTTKQVECGNSFCTLPSNRLSNNCGILQKVLDYIPTKRSTNIHGSQISIWSCISVSAIDL
ncbi:hypothetical protein RJT34_16623 [Clitoria ternatea]|uniref:Uncharacterized protein n=1 Tax=Clitoria ternatea TaxID=43366 RepID=A0AAN9PCE5_CLITE